LTSKHTIIDGRGEHPSNIIDMDYRETWQIHETVVKNQLFGTCMAVPWVPPKWRHEVLLGPPLPHAPGVRMTRVSQTPSNYYQCQYGIGISMNASRQTNANITSSISISITNASTSMYICPSNGLSIA